MFLDFSIRTFKSPKIASELALPVSANSYTGAQWARVWTKPQNQLAWITFNDWFFKNTCSDELRTLFIFLIRSFLGSQDPFELKISLKLCPRNMSISQKNNKKLIGHLKKLILFNQSMVLDFSTSCHIFFIKTVIEAEKIWKSVFLWHFYSLFS